MLKSAFLKIVQHTIFKHNLFLRIMSALVLIPLVLYVVSYGSWLYALWIMLLGVLMMYEFVTIVASRESKLLNKLEWYCLGLLYILLFCWSMVYLRSVVGGYYITMWLLLMVWTTDTCAYVAGLSIGGPKIAPQISPSKTWSGLVGGALGTTAVSFFLMYIYGYSYEMVKQGIYIAPLVAIVSQAGDFLESGFKRHFGVKDSSKIIPGHGGVLDRLDGLVTASWLVALMVLYGSNG